MSFDLDLIIRMWLRHPLDPCPMQLSLSLNMDLLQIFQIPMQLKSAKNSSFDSINSDLLFMYSSLHPILAAKNVFETC